MWPCETIETWKESYAIGEKSVNKNSASMNKWINHSTIVIKAANNFCKNSYLLYTRFFFKSIYLANLVVKSDEKISISSSKIIF